MMRQDIPEISADMLPSESFVLFDEPVGLSNFQALHIRNY